MSTTADVLREVTDKAEAATMDMLTGLNHIQKALALRCLGRLVDDIMAVTTCGVSYGALVAYLAKLEPMMETYEQAAEKAKS